MSDSLTGRANKWDRVLLERFRNDAYDTLVWITDEIVYEHDSKYQKILDEIIELFDNFDMDYNGNGDNKYDD